MKKTDEALREVAEYYDRADTSAELEGAVRDDSSAQERMVTTSLRLPRSTMNDVRTEAERRGLRPTQLLREWIEASLARSGTADAVVPVSKLLELVRDADAVPSRPAGEQTRTGSVPA